MKGAMQGNSENFRLLTPLKISDLVPVYDTHYKLHSPQIILNILD